MLYRPVMPRYMTDDQQLDPDIIMNPSQNCYSSHSKMKSLPMSFKGMILLEIWKNTHQNSYKLQSLTLQSTHKQLQKKRKQKQYYLARWQFECHKNKIIPHTINNILCQQIVSQNSLFYRLKKLVNEQKQIQREREKQTIKPLIQTIKTLAHVQNISQNHFINIQPKPILIDAQINTSPILEQLMNYETQMEEPIHIQKIQKKRSQKKVKLKLRLRDDLISRIQAQMGRQFKKIDKIIHKVNQIQKLTT